MNVKKTQLQQFSLLIMMGLMLGSCTNDPLSPGREYMPDMYRSPAIEEYVDYGEIRDRVRDSLATELRAFTPVKGTVPYSEDASKAYLNFPYPYANTVEDYEKAGAELVNPIVFTEEVYANAKAKYEIFCIHCHGEQGKGNGNLVESGKFAKMPAYSDIDGLTQGKMFHTLMYGKGNMGSHAGQLTREERWELVHYVQTLRDEKYDDPFAETEEAATDDEAPAEEEVMMETADKG